MLIHMFLIKNILCRVLLRTCTDKLTLVLVRWFTAHPDAWERDMLCRPLCSGALRHNHCLWKYAKSSRPRRMMTNIDGSQSQSFVNSGYNFGRNPQVRYATWRTEQHAYYGLITPSSIISTTNMTREYDSNSMIQTDNWLETVTLV
jgi:hypothetical protein